MCRVYIAGQKGSRIKTKLREALKNAGHIVYDPYIEGKRKDWNSYDPDWEKWTAEQIIDAARDSRTIEAALADEEALVDSDAIVVTIPADDTCLGVLGYGRAKGKLTIVLLTPEARANHFFFFADYVLSNLKDVNTMIEEERQ
jgi:hypothetical protein